MAHPKHESVRQRYNYCCGYCGVSETSTGGELTVDHYHPLTSGGSDDDDNLVYACFRCNLFKAQFWPSDAERAQGIRLLHPLNDKIALHYRENPETHLLEALTTTGSTHIGILHLNRSALVAWRASRDRENAVDQREQISERRISDLKIAIDAREDYVQELTWLFNLRAMEGDGE